MLTSGIKQMDGPVCDIRHTRGPVADLPVELGDGLDDRLAGSLDVEGKILRALEALGPVGGRDVLLIGRPGGLRARQLEGLGARVVVASETDWRPDVLASEADRPPMVAPPAPEHRPDSAEPDTSVDVVVGMWSSFRGGSAAELAEAERVARPGGRLLVVHDYGRDDVSRLRGDLAEYGSWSRRGGPFLSNGFRLRVIHCFWSFVSMDDAADFLGAAFGDAGRDVAASMKRPRLSYNVAIYHRDLGVPGTAAIGATPGGRATPRRATPRRATQGEDA
jgi:hypothetical protein